MVRVLGNTWMPIGVGGNFMPGGTSGTSAEYYKCASVSAEAATPEGATFTMQLTLKALSITSTYHWVMDDTSKTGTERTWTGTVEGDSGTHTLHFNGTYWQVVDGLGNTTATETADDPWDITNWHNADGGDVSCTFSDVSSASTGSKTWSGYKAVFDSTAGTWSFESGVTAGLAYTNVTPIVGGIYSADALVIVSLLYTGTPTLTSPTGMTSESSDEWEISASSFYSTNYAPWKAFDGVTGSSSGWTGASNSSWWLQWQNKTKPVLVQKLRFQGTASGDIAQQAITSFILQGSDNGSTWTDLYTASGLTWTTGYEWKEFTFSNSKSYYYHRLANITVAANYPTIIELETYDM